MLFTTMKFSINSEQRNFFRKNGIIEFENLLSKEKVENLKRGFEEILVELVPNLIKASPKEIFLKGRDLFRKSAKVKKEITHHRLLALLFELVQEKPIRLGFDQVFPPFNENFYSEFFLKKKSFESFSSVQNLLCLLNICIQGEGPPPDLQEGDPFPSKPGNGIFFAPTYEVDFEKLNLHKDQTFLLIGFTQQHSQYLYMPEDPQCHILKKIGYVFGDHLDDSLHPVIFR